MPVLTGFQDRTSGVTAESVVAMDLDEWVKLVGTETGSRGWQLMHRCTKNATSRWDQSNEILAHFDDKGTVYCWDSIERYWTPWLMASYNMRYD